MKKKKKKKSLHVSFALDQPVLEKVQQSQNILNCPSLQILDHFASQTNAGRSDIFRIYLYVLG